jgi:hypothetical protein
VEGPEPVDAGRHLGEREPGDRGGGFGELRDWFDRLVDFDRRAGLPGYLPLQALQQNDTAGRAQRPGERIVTARIWCVEHQIEGDDGGAMRCQLLDRPRMQRSRPAPGPGR